MYLVDFMTFKKFIDSINLSISNQILPDCPVPFILEYKRDGIVMAKVEMLSVNEFRFLMKYPRSHSKKISVNKYWIRGKEWDVDEYGNQIKELRI